MLGYDPLQHAVGPSYFPIKQVFKKDLSILRGTWVAQSVKHLPLVQVMIPGPWDGAPYQAPCSVGSRLLSLPLPLLHLGSLFLSLSLSFSNKSILKKKKIYFILAKFNLLGKEDCFNLSALVMSL